MQPEYDRTAVVVGVVVLVVVGVLSVGIGVGVGGAAGTAGATAAADGECSFPLTVTDGSDTEMTIDDEPERVVTVWPSAAQPVWDIGAEERVVGVTHWAHYLEGAENRTNVSYAGGGIDREVIVGLEPDLVLAAHVTDDQAVEALRDAGVTVYQFAEPTSMADIRTNVLVTGQLLGQCGEADRTVEWMNHTVDAVEAATPNASEDRPRVLYVTPFGYGPGTDTFAHTIIETAGGENVLATAGLAGWGQVNPEVVAAQDPEWIVVNDRQPEIPDGAVYQNTTAVTQNRTVVVAHPHINQPGPRVVYAMVTLANEIHDAGIEVEHPQDWDPEPFRVEPTAESPDAATGLVGAAVGATVLLVAGVLLWRERR